MEKDKSSFGITFAARVTKEAARSSSTIFHCPESSFKKRAFRCVFACLSIQTCLQISRLFVFNTAEAPYPIEVFDSSEQFRFDRIQNASCYWPGPQALGMKHSNLTDTCTFSLAIDDSDETNGCLRYVAGSGAAKTLRSHQPLSGNRDEGHALTAVVDEATEDVQLAPAKRGSLTIHDEWVVHGSAGNMCPNRQRRTYVVAFRAKEIVDAERHIGFSHSHNDKVNWDTFDDGASHRVVTNKDNN